MRTTASKIRIIEPTVLQSIDDRLHSHPDAEVVDVSGHDHILNAEEPLSDVLSTVTYVVAPGSGLYTPAELQAFMIDLVPDLDGIQEIKYESDQFGEKGGKNQHTGPRSLVFGNYRFREKVGRRILTLEVTDQKLREDRTVFDQDGTFSLEGDVYRQIRVHPFPNAQYARDVLSLNPFDKRPRDAAEAAQALANDIGFFRVPYRTLKAYMPKQAPAKG